MGSRQCPYAMSHVPHGAHVTDAQHLRACHDINKQSKYLCFDFEKTLRPPPELWNTCAIVKRSV